MPNLDLIEAKRITVWMKDESRHWSENIRLSKKTFGITKICNQQNYKFLTKEYNKILTHKIALADEYLDLLEEHV